MAERRKKIEAGDQGTEAAARKPRSRKVRTEPAVNEATSAPEAGDGKVEDRGNRESRPQERGAESASGGGYEARIGCVERPAASTTPDATAGPDESRNRPTLNDSDAPRPPGPAPSPDGPRALLPGELYQRQDQWWWRVQLPGEDKATARPLKTNGEETPAEGRGDACVARTAAEQIALALWEHAVEEKATRRIRLESTEKIERLKAQFLDKVRHFTELVETANAKLETEQRARAEAEAKLAQMARTVEPMTGGPPALGGHPEHVGPSPSGVIPFDRQPGVAVPPMEQAEPEMPMPPVPHPPIAPLSTPTPDPPAAIAPVPPSVPAPTPCERIPIHAGPAEPREPVVARVVAPLPAAVETGLCECCGATGVAVTHLTRIDSGQLLCPRCLTVLRAEAARFE